MFKRVQQFNRVQKVKQHVRNNKTTYIVGASCLAVGAACSFVYFRSSLVPEVIIAPVQKNIALAQYKPSNHLTQQVTIELPARGHRRNVIVNDNTGEIFASQNEAARKLGVSPACVSQHLNGSRDNLNGVVLKNLGENVKIAA